MISFLIKKKFSFIFLSFFLAWSGAEAKKAKSSQPEIVTANDYKHAVNRIVERHSRDVKSCRKISLKTRGRLILAWENDEKGHARNFTKGEDTLNDEKFYHCLVKKIEKWKFPVPPGERSIDLSYDFVY